MDKIKQIIAQLKSSSSNIFALLLLFLLAIGVIVGCYAFAGWLFMLLYNVIAVYFGFKIITFPISLVVVIAIFLLSTIFGK